MGQFNNDKTLERNYVQKWKFLIGEYREVKQKRHSRFRLLDDFYRHHGICRQNFLKYLGRYSASGDLSSLLPQKRGPRWKARRTDHDLVLRALEEREKGLNRYEICNILKTQYPERSVPAPSTIYCIFKRHGVNRLKPRMKEEKRKIIKQRAGELGHLDCHYLSKEMILDNKKRYYLVCLLDDYSRIAWAEVVEDIKSLTVMFAALKGINWLNVQHKMQFEEVITDNGAEFNGQKNKLGHPFERMLIELGIKHRYTKPYSPQTNGKVERFWRTLNDDLINETTFKSLEEFKKELHDYLLYYNYERPHQALNGTSPAKFLGTKDIAPN